MVGQGFFKAAKEARANVVVGTLFTQQYAMDVAEAMRVPCWVTKLAPDDRTAHAPVFGQAPSTLPGRLGRWANLASHWSRLLSLVRAATDTGFTDLQNAFRQRYLSLPPVGLGRMGELNRTPTLYGISSTVVPRPPDWAPWLRMCGYWMTEDADFSPSEELERFLAAGPAPVCVNFGSMSVLDETDLVPRIVRAVTATGYRCLLVTGWGAVPDESAVPHTDDVFFLKQAPHEWLFPRCAAVVYHGGAGTAARVLQSGVPSVIVPVLRFYDQCGWADAIEARGAGVHVRQPTDAALRDAVASVAPIDSAARGAAQLIAAALREEDGLAEAVAALTGCLCNHVGLAGEESARAMLQRCGPDAEHVLKDDAVAAMCRRHCLACTVGGSDAPAGAAAPPGAKKEN